MNPQDPLSGRYYGAPGSTPAPGGPVVPTRPDGLQVPPRPVPIQDIDDSAFGYDYETTGQAAVLPAQPTPHPSPNLSLPPPYIPVAPAVPQDIMPPASIPRVPVTPPVSRPVAQPSSVTLQPAAPVAQPVQNIGITAEVPQADYIPPPLTPVVSPAATTSAPQVAAPQPAQPVASPSMPQPTPVVYSPEPQANPVQPLSPLPANAAADSAIHHLPAELAARIAEVPLQNSKDVQAKVEHHNRFQHFRGFVSFLVFVGGILFAAFLINQFIFQSYYVDGTSMTPTLQHDDRLIITKTGRTWAGLQGKPYIPKRGEIIVLDSSLVRANGQFEQLIKRVIGLPGDTVVVGDGNKVMVKNAENPEGFDVDQSLGLTDLKPTHIDQTTEFVVPEGEVFVMGDNRGENGSYDSRAFGPIEASKIEGVLWARIFPLDKAKVF